MAEQLSFTDIDQILLEDLMDNSLPLTDAEYDELEQFLMSDATGNDAMDISTLDGFLTALISGPNVIKPSQWLPKVWASDHMQWSSTVQAERIISLILRHMNAISDTLMHSPDDFEPLTYTREHEGQTSEIIDEWCTGFYEGMRTDLPAWRSLMESDELQGILLPIMLYGTESGWDEVKTRPDIAERHDEFVQLLPRCVRSVYQHWAPQRKAAVQDRTIRHKQPLPGRNDPCPCGSGKKFKKCCGNTTTVH